MKIPFYGIKRFYEQNRQEVLDIIDSAYATGMIFGGEIEMFEKDLCGLTGRKFSFAVNSCTDALFFALKSAGLTSGDEVLVTSFSFIASASPIVRAGAVPVFVDIDPRTYLMDTEDLKRKITGKTRAIIAVHLNGQTLKMTEIEQLAAKHDLFLIEDAAQAMGATSENRKAGSMGDVSCLSFDPTKIISAFGSGGALLTDSEETYGLVKKLRYHGKGEGDDYELAGYNCRLSASQCALLRYQINKHLVKRIKRLREIAAIYHTEFCTIEEIILPELYEEFDHIYHKFVIQTNNRDKLRAHLKENEIETMTHYSKPLFEYSLFQRYEYRAEDISACRAVCSNVLLLPVYPELTDAEIDYICKTVKSFYK